MLLFMPAHTYFTSSFTTLLTGISVLQKELAKIKEAKYLLKKTESQHIDIVCNSSSIFLANFEQVCDVLSMHY